MFHDLFLSVEVVASSFSSFHGEKQVLTHQTQSAILRPIQIDRGGSSLETPPTKLKPAVGRWSVIMLAKSAARDSFHSFWNIPGIFEWSDLFIS